MTMLLVFDIGNTNIKIALLEGEQIKKEWRISTDARRTADEYFSILRPLLREAEISADQIGDAVISSVVPPLIGAFVSVSQLLINKKPLVITPEIYGKLPVTLPASAVYEIGTDLLADAVAAWEKNHAPCIIADFGTALSFVAVDGQGNILGVAIAPGIGTALRSLFTNTAQLPSVPLDVPPSVLGTNTTEAIQSGILFGYKSLVEGMVSSMKNEMAKKASVSVEKIRTVATGGLNSILQSITNVFDEIDKDLTVKGIAKISAYSNG